MRIAAVLRTNLWIRRICEIARRRSSCDRSVDNFAGFSVREHMHEPDWYAVLCDHFAFRAASTAALMRVNVSSLSYPTKSPASLPVGSMTIVVG